MDYVEILLITNTDKYSILPQGLEKKNGVNIKKKKKKRGQICDIAKFNPTNCRIPELLHTLSTLFLSPFGVYFSEKETKRGTKEVNKRDWFQDYSLERSCWNPKILSYKDLFSLRIRVSSSKLKNGQLCLLNSIALYCICACCLLYWRIGFVSVWCVILFLFVVGWYIQFN